MGVVLNKTVLFNVKQKENEHNRALKMYESCIICESTDGRPKYFPIFYEINIGTQPHFRAIGL